MTQRRHRRAGVEDRWRDLKKPRVVLGENKRPVLDEFGEPVTTLQPVNYGKGSRWRARYVDDRGREHAQSFSRKTDASKWLDEVTSTLVTGEYVAPDRTRTTVDELHARWIRTFGDLKATTIAAREAAWRKHVEPKWGSSLVTDVRNEDIKVWVSDLKAAGAKAPTIESALGVLRMVLELAAQPGDGRLIARNPCDGVRAPRRESGSRGYLTHTQVDRLAAEVGDRYSAVILFLAYTGLRYGEMAALTCGDVVMLRRRVNVRRSVTEVKGVLTWSTPKNHEQRSVPFPSFLSEYLARAMEGKGREDLVFTAPEGGVLRLATFRTRTLNRAVATLVEAGEFPRVTVHDLRHTAASLAISAGANVKAVQTMLGHKSAVLTLDTYSDLFPDDLERVADALDVARKSAADVLRTETQERPHPVSRIGP